ncbi:hypothetical protein [Streptomyces sp. FIT100]|uniref:hypothetical protein n=1 Tax=Streptomyces sp. FIT100 TaxID=2837956 RepID=UPI0028BD65BB|nr:hypothetical protein [Streptomyces sp. FIT100]
MFPDGCSGTFAGPFRDPLHDPFLGPLSETGPAEAAIGSMAAQTTASASPVVRMFMGRPTCRREEV